MDFLNFLADLILGYFPAAMLILIVVGGIYMFIDLTIHGLKTKK